MTRRLLLLLLLLGAAGNLGGTGTLASFNASTTNPGATFATGSVVLSNQVGTATSCLSTGAGTSTDTNANANCNALFTLATKKPGDTASVDLTIKNVGTLPGTLRLYRSAACTSGDAAGTAYHGTGNICDAIELYIQRYPSVADRTADTRTGTAPLTACLYGGGTATNCAFDATKDLTAFSTFDNDNGANPVVAGTDYLDLGAMGADDSAAGGSDERILRLYFQLPSSVGNNIQGLVATFGFTWYLEQS